MAAKNNFKELEEEQLGLYPHTPSEVGNNVKGSMRLFSFVGDIVELYLPKVFDMLLSLVGGERAPQRGSSEADLDEDDASPIGEQKPD